MVGTLYPLLAAFFTKSSEKWIEMALLLQDLHVCVRLIDIKSFGWKMAYGGSCNPKGADEVWTSNTSKISIDKHVNVDR